MSLLTEEMILLADLQDRQPFGVSAVQRLKHCNYFQARVLVDDFLERGLVEAVPDQPWSFRVRLLTN